MGCDRAVPKPPAKIDGHEDPPRAPLLPVFGPNPNPTSASLFSSRWRRRRPFSRDALAAVACAAHGHSPLHHALAGRHGAEAPAAFVDPSDPDTDGDAFATCQWIEGDLHDNAARYCGAPALPRQAWCQDHFRRVYLPASGNETQREIARLFIIANNRKIGRETTYYVDRDFDFAPGGIGALLGFGHPRGKASP